MPPLPDGYVLRDREELARLMGEANHSYRTLAAVAKVGKTPLWKLRRGHQLTCSYPVAERIANALNVTVADLFRPQRLPEEG